MKEDIPKNEEILSNIKINFKNSDDIDDEVPFCLSKGEFINIRYKNRLEKYIIFTSLYQIKMGAERKQYFLDGTFKAAPKGYYQILNIWGFKENNNIYNQ